MTDEEREARDPNTPPARLLELLLTHPRAVGENPGLALLLLEHPDFWDGLTRRQARALASSPDCPLAYATWAAALPHSAEARYYAPHRELINNPALPPAL